LSVSDLSGDGKILRFDKPIKKGVCSMCGVTGKPTTLYHINRQYDESDSLKYTKELCLSCQAKRRIQESKGMKRDEKGRWRGVWWEENEDEEERDPKPSYLEEQERKRWY